MMMADVGEDEMAAEEDKKIENITIETTDGEKKSKRTIPVSNGSEIQNVRKRRTKVSAKRNTVHIMMRTDYKRKYKRKQVIAHDEGKKNVGNIRLKSLESSRLAVSECGLCHIQVVSKIHHVWAYHMSEMPLYCSKCNRGFGTQDRHRLQKHIIKVHKGQTEFVDKRNELNGKVQEFLKKCFPAGSLVKEKKSVRNIRLKSLESLRYTCEIEMLTCQKCNEKVVKSHCQSHSWSHFGVKPLKCSICNCTFGYNAMTGALKHLENAHASINGEIIDQRKQHRDAYVVVHKQCFPKEKNAEPDKVTCSLCKEEVIKGYRITSHTWRHFDVKPFECSLCDRTFGFSHISRALKHLENDHRGINGEIIDQRLKYYDDYAIVRKQCFPNEIKASFQSRNETGANLFENFNYTEGSRRNDNTITTTAEPATVVCSLCEEEITTGHPLYDHVWSHMKIKRFSCSVCCHSSDSSMAVRRHLAFTHNNRGNVLDRRPLFTSEYESMFDNCFPDTPVYHPTSLSPNSPKIVQTSNRPPVLKPQVKIPIKRNVGNTMKPKRKYKQKRVVVHNGEKKMVKNIRNNSQEVEVRKCGLCNFHVVTKAHHVWAHHMSQRPFSCSKCNQGFRLHDRHILIKHIGRVHEGQAKVIDRRAELSAEVKKFVEICFPPSSFVSDGLTYGKRLGLKINKPVLQRVHTTAKEPEEEKAVEPFVMIEHEGLINDSEDEALQQLAYLIAPVLPDSFLEKIWQKNVTIVRRKCQNYYDNLFTKSLFQKVIENHHLQWGKDVTMLRYFDSKQDCLNHDETAAHPTRVWDLYRESCYSILLHHPQRFSAHVWKVCDGLQELFCTHVIGTVYMTPINSSTCPPHWQDMDEFIIQTNGRKHWSLYKPKYDTQMFPAGTTSESSLVDGDVIFDDWVEQGDFLYIPRGFISFAKTTDQPSVHVTVRIPNKNNSYGAMVKKLLPKMMCLHPELRESFPVQYLSYTGTSEQSNRVQDRVAFEEKLKEFMGKLSDRILDFVDSGVDLMAMEFMKNAIPPALTSTERASSCISDRISSSLNLTHESRVKLLRKHGQTLIYRPHETVLVHRMKNERDCNQTTQSEIIVDQEAVSSLELLMKNYPNFTSIKELPAESDQIKLDLIGNLYENNIILVEQ